MDEADYYDEFGNYIGPAEESLYAAETHLETDDHESAAGSVDEDHVQDMPLRQVVLHEDKKHYLSAAETYGMEVEVLVEDEDRQTLTEPIIAPIRQIRLERPSDAASGLRYSADFLCSLAETPRRCRNVAFLGHIHHGKTLLVNALVDETFDSARPRAAAAAQTTDSLLAEKERGVSLRAKAVTLLLPDSDGCSHVLNVVDVPGHSDFREDAAAALAFASDSVVLVVDCVEGVQAETELLLQAACIAHRPVILVLSKLERLILELRLPPLDAYHKLRHTIDRLNTLCSTFDSDLRFTPETGNVVFASAAGGWAFTLATWARVQCDRQPKPHPHKASPAVDPEELSKRLWGNVYYVSAERRFRRVPAAAGDGAKRTFVAFVLEPLYKLYTQVLSVDAGRLCASFQDGAGVHLSQSHVEGGNVRPLLRHACRRFFSGSTGQMSPVQGLIDAIVRVCPSPEICADDTVFSATICKVYPPASFRLHEAQIDLAPRVLVRVWQGRLGVGQSVSISEPSNFSDTDTDNDVEMLQATVGHVTLPGSNCEIARPDSASQLLLISGLPLESIVKYGVITGSTNGAALPIAQTKAHALFTRLHSVLRLQSHLKVSLEPLLPAELPRMLGTLRLLALVHPSLAMRVEENGEHVLMGPGELYLDCALHDLRQLGQLQLRLSDPCVAFAETVQETSLLKCFADTMNGRLRLTMIAEPLEKGLAEALEAGVLDALDVPARTRLLETQYGWDKVSARSLLAVSGASVLVDDTFGARSEILNACKSALIQGFQWAVREGPLCEEPVRAVKFRLLDIAGADSDAVRLADLSPAQIVPAARRVCYSAFLTAAPRLLEPVAAVSILAPADCLEAVYTCLARRRGHVLADTPVPATPLYCLQALLPMLDAAGFEVDLRVVTHGLAFPTARFDHWQPVPGDPLDATIHPAILEPASAPALARDCLLKTRRRRGIGETVRIDKFFDDPMLQVLAREQLLGQKGM